MKINAGKQAVRLAKLSTKHLRFFVLMMVFPCAIGVAQVAEKNVAQTNDVPCKALAKVDFSTIPDAPTHITEAVLVTDLQGLLGKAQVSPELAKAVGPIQPTCRVSGYVAPSAGFILLLPVSQWNGKLLHVGCGGWCGSTDYVGGSCAMHPGYACVGTDMGHTGGGGLWSRNNLQGQIDFAYRATHVVTVAAKTVLRQFYSAEPKQSYFMGCSTGGYQAMVEAQRFPWDFQGIIAGAPDMDESDLAVRGIWMKRNFLGDDQKPILSDADIQLLHNAVLAKCDMDDGVKDGIVSAPYMCAFDAAKLQCKGDKQGDCLSARQVTAVKNIYDRPRTSKGQPISPRAVFPGAELQWKGSFSNTWGDEFFKDTALLSIPGKEWSYRDFDFDRDYKRSGIGVLYPDRDPDLRKFRDAGGKLLGYQGDTDMVEMPGAAFDYYETVEKTMGGAKATQEFYRLFAIPGMNHCGGGDGASVVDYLGYLETWVERGRAPDVMIGAHLSGSSRAPHKMPLDPATPVTFTRPVYPYPLHAKYKGSGDHNDAANFEPAQ
ncbi:MAG: tannase/feruloyl esterase family alpha/beta hydrolase [Acidobacteriaceae bacterium]